MGEDEDKPDMSPVSKAIGSPGLAVIVWSAVSSFFNTNVLLTPITSTKLAGKKFV
jgi:hypothetical protein